MSAPLGLHEVRKLYGDPTSMIREDGTVSPFWEARMTMVSMPYPLKLGWDDRFARGVRVNQAIADETAKVFELLERGGHWTKLRTFDGGYAWRPQRGATKTLSLHAYGAALDFDAATNQLGDAGGDMDEGVVRVFEACGWTWGGRFARPDRMHFQFARGV